MQANITDIFDSNGLINVKVDYIDNNDTVIQSTTYPLTIGTDISMLYPIMKQVVTDLTAAQTQAATLQKNLGIVDLSKVQSTSEITA